ncbi:hypothetical protein FQZ97_976050 [compost metagenome]
MVARVGPGQQVLPQHAMPAQRGDGVSQQRVEMCRAHGARIVPPDGVFGQVVANDELVLGRAAGEGAGFHDKRTMGAQCRPTLADGRRNQCGDNGVVAQRHGSIRNSGSETVMIERRHGLALHSAARTSGGLMGLKIEVETLVQPSRNRSYDGSLIGTKYMPTLAQPGCAPYLIRNCRLQSRSNGAPALPVRHMKA